jgi:phosphatidate cytidylyltransferase
VNTPAPPTPDSPGFGRDIYVRTIAALVMAGLALVSAAAGSWPFALATGLLGCVAAWEWGRITRDTEWDHVTIGHALLAVLVPLAGTAGYGLPALVVTLVAAAAVTLAGLRYVGLGLLLTVPPALALVYLRSDPAVGLLAVFYVFLVVWVTDTAALLWGRAVGGPKLWPRVSPKKTWAGAMGGAGSAMIAALLFSLAIPFMPSAAWPTLLALLLSVVSQVGDLALSAVKRRFGRKDASRLIPGHGGLLDRIDGLMLAAVVAALIGGILSPHHPGAALLGLTTG